MLLAVVSVTSCSDVWDTHYNTGVGIQSNLKLADYIKSQPDLSTFSKMLQISHMDSALNKPQTYTVWAPLNNALEGVNLNDTVLVKNIVKNHISRFSYPTSDITNKTIFMLAAKFNIFSKAIAGYTFGGKAVTEANILANNGVLHKLNGYVPYMKNLWEFIGTTPGLDSLRNYMYSQSTSVFDPVASVEIGTDALNRAIYDSVIIFSNPILDKIGHINMEDSTFATILPSNKAWSNVYGRIKTSYKTLAKDGGTTQQRLNTEYAIVQNMIFKFNSLTTEPDLYDSLTSTTGSLYRPSAYLFDNSTKNTLSNGLAYVTDSLRFKAADSWQKPIMIEGENSNYGRSSLNASLYVRSSLGSTFTTSQNKFLVCEPTSVTTSSPASVTIPIPNTLSGKYKIYCVFVPTSIVNAADARKYKVSFNLSYLNATGVAVPEAPISSTNLIKDAGTKPGVFTTDASTITKMYVTQIDFPFCNILTKKSLNSDITVKLKIQNAALINETSKFDRTFRIDYIVLEPVQ